MMSNNPKMDADEIQNYWDQRASTDGSAQSTTMDFYLREIEFKCVDQLIQKTMPTSVFDIGCGDARTTYRLAAKHPHIKFVGGDFAPSMIKNATRNINERKVDNIELIAFDASKPSDLSGFDLVYTNRCLINLASWAAQQEAIKNIYRLLSPNGTYVMIENFLDGQADMNAARTDYGLPEIKIREHNFFFEQEALFSFVKPFFDVREVQNISSSYYLVTRVVYSKICQEKGATPDYFDEHHRLAAELPFCGNYGPVKMVILAKRS
jgi:ubiquinone/menaquinone biosynthesis C-methylase UbiE